MNYFVVEPEVAGGLGDRAVLDRSIHPPLVSSLHYELDGWLGDVLLESFPCFIVTSDAAAELRRIGASGVAFGTVEVTASPTYFELHPDGHIPQCVWLQPTGVPGRDDVAALTDGRLVLSGRALDALRSLQLSSARIEPFDG